MDMDAPLKLKNGLRRRKPEQNDAVNHVAMTTRRRSSWPRIFKPQLSITDHLLKTDKSFQIVRDIAMIQIVLFLGYILIRDLYINRRDMVDLSYLYASFGTPATIMKALAIEVSLLAMALLVHPVFQLWRHVRGSIPALKWAVSWLFITAFTVYVFGTAAFVCWISYTVPFGTYATLILTVEQLRLSMKTYSYVRENAHKVVYPWREEDESGPGQLYRGQMKPTVGSFSKFAFFLFAPTLLYRDNYPRNPGPVNWKNVIIYFTQFILSMWCVSLLCSEFIFPTSLRSDVLLLSYMGSLVCILPIIILSHTCFLHSYLNFSCELFRFADREFYGDWWTSTSFSTFYRKWNMLVHDWLHSYVYREMKHVTGRQWLAVFATIHISAMIHEYIIAVALHFAVPLLFIEFAIGGVIVYFLRPKSMERLFNVLLLIGFGFGGANLIFLYQVEFAARLYCPKQLTIQSFFYPQMIDCYHHTNSNISSAIY